MPSIRERTTSSSSIDNQPSYPLRLTVIVVPVDPEKRMPGLGTWWDVPVAEVSTEEQTRKTREKYEQATKKQRPIFA
jgi:TPP-dependent trihydroxycyclohexane-1,2-dione (THcHDO) dehydratase